MSKQRAALYLRQSTFREESISLELQERACREYARQQGYDVVAVESDPGISGRTFNRPGVTKVMSLVENRKADIIVLWKWSRLSRSRLDWAVAADKVETIGGRIESATEAVDVSTSTGRLARGMLTEFAAFESERIGDSWKETQARRLRNGLPHNGSDRFGYTYSRETGFVPDGHTGEILRAMYLAFNRGTSFQEIATMAEDMGHAPETGWRANSIRRMLDRGFGAGYLWTKGELIKGAHEAVITEAEWEEYRVRRDARKIRGRAESTDYPFSGLLHCHCGSTMGGAYVRRGQKIHRRYLCLEASQKYTHTQSSISEPKVEAAVLAWLETVAEDVDAATAAKLEKPSARPKASPAERIARDLLKNQMRLDTLTIKHLDGDVGQEVYARLKAQLEAEKASLEAAERARKVIASTPPSAVVPGLLEAWETLPGRGKREVLSRLIAKIQLHDWENGSRKVEIVPIWV